MSQESGIRSQKSEGINPCDPIYALEHARAKMRAQGVRISKWARAHGFKPDTVFHVLGGHRGLQRHGYKSSAILSLLKEQGFLDTTYLPQLRKVLYEDDDPCGVHNILNRLKRALNLRTDKALAKELGLAQTAVPEWRRKKRLNYKVIVKKYCHSLDLNYIFCGKSKWL